MLGLGFRKNLNFMLYDLISRIIGLVLDAVCMSAQQVRVHESTGPVRTPLLAGSAFSSYSLLNNNNNNNNNLQIQ
jgi:hypothetical protein